MAESELRALLAEAADAAETPPEPVERERPEAATEAQEKPEAPSGDRLRGPDGKFLPKETAQSEETGEEPVETETEEPETEQPAEKPEVKEPAVDVPPHWSQADKDLIAKLPAEHRKPVVDTYKRMEAAWTPKLMRAAELEKQFGGAEELFKPYAETLRQRNQTASDVVRAWASVERGFIEGMQDAQQGRPNQKGAQLIANLIRNYQVDPGAIAAILQGQLAQPANGADRAAAAHTVTIPPELARRLDELEARETQRAQEIQTNRETEAQRQIDHFAAEKDEQGNLKHPYFAELEPEIMRLARLDVAERKPIDLADLYDKAAYANRETRAKLLSAQSDEQKRKAAVERKAKAVAAQRAASSVTGSSPAGQTSTEQRRGIRSLREDLEEAAAESDAA
jgi:hypothetical protein